LLIKQNRILKVLVVTMEGPKDTLETVVNELESYAQAPCRRYCRLLKGFFLFVFWKKDCLIDKHFHGLSSGVRYCTQAIILIRTVDLK
jgi:hypothetical protein